MPGRVREFNAIQAAGIAAALGIPMPGCIRLGPADHCHGQHAARATSCSSQPARAGRHARSPAVAVSRPTLPAPILLRDAGRTLQAAHCTSYIFACPERIDSLNCGLVKFNAASSARLVIRRTLHQLRCGRGKLAVQHHQPFAGLIPGHAQQIGLSGIQILRVPRVGDPHRLALAQHAREPVDLAQQILQPLRVVGLGKQKLLLPAAVVARGHRHRLAVARLEELQAVPGPPSCAPRCRRRSPRRAAPSLAQSRQRSASPRRQSWRADCARRRRPGGSRRAQCRCPRPRSMWWKGH